LLPVPELNKKALCRCDHQRLHGCAIYDRRPLSCRVWSCGWHERAPGTDHLRRPDRSHIVIDIMLDTILAEGHPIRVVQLWCDPKFRDAWRAPEIMDFMQLAGRNNCASMVRYSSTEATIVFPPEMTGGAWVVNDTSQMLPSGYKFSPNGNVVSSR
jgi:hypothetical protein